jgi:hypothetical protein
MEKKTLLSRHALGKVQKKLRVKKVELKMFNKNNSSCDCRGAVVVLFKF